MKILRERTSYADQPVSVVTPRQLEYNLTGRRKIALTRPLRLSPSCCNLECVDEPVSNLQFFWESGFAEPALFGMQVRLSRSNNLDSTITMQIFHGAIANLFVGSEHLFAHAFINTNLWR
jgi:hypothetical protein